MDSFYDQPRNAPKPTSINKLTGPIIPEVSIIQPPITNIRQNVRHQSPNVESYNVWKARNATNQHQGNKENFNPLSTNRQFSDPGLRKHVRFESAPIQRTNSSPCQMPMLQKEEQNKNLGIRPLEEIYMANIPNRNLDLSILELPTNKKCVSVQNQNVPLSDNHDINCYDIYNYKGSVEKDVTQTKTYAEFKKQMNDEKQSNSNSVKPIAHHSYKSDSYNSNRISDEFLNKQPLYSRDLYNELTKSDCDTKRQQLFCCDSFTHRDSYVPRNGRYDLQVATKSRNDDEPTTRDLLKVIQQQNEQILLLQKQVACLLETKSKQRQIENVNYDLPTSNSPVDQEKYKKLKKGPLSKIAIDVMTSFEVSFRPQNQNSQRNKLREIDDSPKIEEIGDGVSDVNNVLDGIKKNDKFGTNDDVSLSLQEPLKVVERCPSPEESIHVEMQDYSSDEEDADSDLGWTLYNNIMGQVNNIFKNSQNDPQRAGTAQGNPDLMKDKTLKRVKEATMKHLKTIGVNLPLIEEDGTSKVDSKNNDEFKSSDVSFAVKQLLMKYLPDEQLAKLTYSEAKQTQSKEHLIKRRPEFSFATIQYMKKYNLLGTDSSKGQVSAKPQTNSPKILDVTALKQQPKLL